MIFVTLVPLTVFTTFPVLLPPEPENVLKAFFGETLILSPKLTVPVLLLILTAPMIAGNEPHSLHPHTPVERGFSRNKCRMFFVRESKVMQSLEPI